MNCNKDLEKPKMHKFTLKLSSFNRVEVHLRDLRPFSNRLEVDIGVRSRFVDLALCRQALDVRKCALVCKKPTIT